MTMGYLAAADMAAHAELDVALRWHLSANHYPPMPVELVSTAKEAIERAGDEEWDEEIELPEGITYRGQPTAPVHACVEAWHLQPFVDAVLADDMEEEE